LVWALTSLDIALVGLRASVTAAVPGGGRFPEVDDD